MKIIIHAPHDGEHFWEICLDLTIKPSDSRAEPVDEDVGSDNFITIFPIHVLFLCRFGPVRLKMCHRIQKKRQSGRYYLLEFLRRARYERRTDGEEANKEGDQSK